MDSEPEVTAEDVKKRFEDAAKQPRDPNLRVTCICGKYHAEDVKLTDEDYQEIANILNGKS